MTVFRLTKKAIEDLRSIGRYTQKKWGREQRNQYLTRLDESFQTIAREPEIGFACDDIRQGYRQYHVGRHLVFYRRTDRDIIIIRILHDRMDIDNRLLKDR